MLDLSMISYVGVQGRLGRKDVTDYMCKICENILTKIKFNEIVILTAEYPSFVPKSVKIVLISPINYNQYNELAFNRLHKWSKGDYIMTFQEDGFAINPEKWTNDFLQYDYIGAPWPLGCGWSWENKEVGNGGFSLRSRKLYKECENLKMVDGAHEDGVICITYRDHLKSKGIKFACLDIGKRFSIEYPFDDSHSIQNTFGFHGKQHLETANKIIGMNI